MSFKTTFFVRVNFFSNSKESVRIPLKLDSHSTANWSAIPQQTGQLFQPNLITSERSDAGYLRFTPKLSTRWNLLIKSSVTGRLNHKRDMANYLNI